MNDRTCAILRLLRESNDYLSGSRLSRELGITRAAVWKQIAVLREEGHRIEATPSRGYRLLSSPDLLDEPSLRSLLPTGCLVGRRLVCAAATSSTNSDAFRLAEEGAPEGTVVLADSQSGGKGRLGRRWESPAGVNLYCSVILRPPLLPHEASQLTFLSAVAVARTIEAVTGLHPGIKWPNDLLLGERKVAGLLNEMSAETDRVGFVILGIGVNINMQAHQFPDGLRHPATSLLLASGTTVSRSVFTVRLFQELAAGYERFLREGFDPVREEWAGRSTAFGREVAVDTGAGILRGPFSGIDRDGALLLQRPDGSLERVLSGDVTVY
ncbi:biotin--[acetyl-CoA-carboxylase] ligase [Trichlorobacter ammonificans]|uniref:Bifunctional ligase/repressor BirA n=1 Tax=Trichlorobacter ammonificans TaxID=2916410 RepID=A0ABM9D569_9BACT|nr:biotin--[acetyl-CoA-carboxylase] ligase [Trichlorobacter ammonificans]CAH2030379.1 Bifunctional ligase/repressor BirA [Trichlorobacter ammonificans]